MDIAKLEPILCTSREAAKALAIGTRKLWSLTVGGEIPHVRIGKCVRYLPEDLRRYAEAQRRDCEAQLAS